MAQFRWLGVGEPSIWREPPYDGGPFAEWAERLRPSDASMALA